METAKEMQTLMESAQLEEDRRMINMQSFVKQNDQKLDQKMNQQVQEAKQFLSKALRKRLDKIKADKSLA